MGQQPGMSHGRSLRAYKKSPSIRAGGIMSIVDSHGGGDHFPGFGGFDDLSGGGGGRVGPGTPFDKYQKMGPRGYRHTGLTPDVGLLGIAPFGSPQGKSPMPPGASHYFPTGLTPSDGTPLSEIGHIYTNGSISPSYSPSIFFLLANADGSPRMQTDRLPICPNCNATVFGSNCRCSGIGAGLSAIKAENEEVQEAMHKSAILTKRKLEGDDDDAEYAELDASFATDAPSESSLDRSSMSNRFVAARNRSRNRTKSTPPFNPLTFHPLRLGTLLFSNPPPPHPAVCYQLATRRLLPTSRNDVKRVPFSRRDKGHVCVYVTNNRHYFSAEVEESEDVEQDRAGSLIEADSRPSTKVQRALYNIRCIFLLRVLGQRRCPAPHVVTSLRMDTVIVYPRETTTTQTCQSSTSSVSSAAPVACAGLRWRWVSGGIREGWDLVNGYDRKGVDVVVG